jgi:hypothetical protein
MSITVNTVPFHPGQSSSSHLSPTCVIMHPSKAENFVEHLLLEPSIHQQRQGVMEIHPKEGDRPIHDRIHTPSSPSNPNSIITTTTTTASKRPSHPMNDVWMCPVSKKCKLAVNPIQPMVAQVAGRIRPAAQRRDRKSPLSLAVSTKRLVVGKARFVL